MLAPTVGAAVVNALAQAGLQRIYGIVGDSLNPITDVLHRSREIKWVHVRHEKPAASCPLFSGGGSICPELSNNCNSIDSVCGDHFDYLCRSTA